MKTAYSPSGPIPENLELSRPQTLFANPFMHLISDKVRCERTGKTQDFYKLVFTNWVNVVALTEGGDLVLIRQYRFGTDQVELEIPGGAINEGESPVAAGCRELLEETGFAGENCRIIGQVCPNPAIQNNYCYTVLVENARKVVDPAQDDMEDIEVLTFPWNKVKSLIHDGTIRHGLVLNGLMFFNIESQPVGPTIARK